MKKTQCFVDFQSFSHVWLFATPWTGTCQASLSFLSPRVCTNIFRKKAIRVGVFTKEESLTNDFPHCIVAFFPLHFPSPAVFQRVVTILFIPCLSSLEGISKWCTLNNKIHGGRGVPSLWGQLVSKKPGVSNSGKPFLRSLPEVFTTLWNLMQQLLGKGPHKLF